MQKWEYCIFSAYETSAKTQFTISYHKQVERPQADNRLEVMAELGRQG